METAKVIIQYAFTTRKAMESVKEGSRRLSALPVSSSELSEAAQDGEAGQGPQVSQGWARWQKRELKPTAVCTQPSEHAILTQPDALCGADRTGDNRSGCIVVTFDPKKKTQLVGEPTAMSCCATRRRDCCSLLNTFWF